MVGEADGLEKYGSSIATVRAEKLRQERLEQAGLGVVRWGWNELDNFGQVANRLRAAFARAQRRDRAPRDWRVVAGSPRDAYPCASG